MKKQLFLFLSLFIFAGQLFGAFEPIPEEDEPAVAGDRTPCHPINLSSLCQLVQKSPVYTANDDKRFLEGGLGDDYKQGCFEVMGRDFNETLQAFRRLMLAQLTDEHNQFPEGIFSWYPIVPFVQRKMVAPDARIITVGDLHGGIQTLINILLTLLAEDVLDNNFKIVDPNVHLVFLGDYVDRGPYGVEVIYTLARLKLANPDQVVVLRGNHEDVGMNAADPGSDEINFEDELEFKFGHPAQRWLEFVDEHFYKQLPLACYFGNGHQWIQFCHGGIDPHYNPQAFLHDPDAAKQYGLVYDFNNADDGLVWLRALDEPLQHQIAQALLLVKQQQLPSMILPARGQFLVTIVDLVNEIIEFFNKYLREQVVDKNLGPSAEAIGRLHEELNQMYGQYKTSVDNYAAALNEGRIEDLLGCADELIDRAKIIVLNALRLTRAYHNAIDVLHDPTYQYPSEDARVVFTQLVPELLNNAILLDAQAQDYGISVQELSLYISSIPHIPFELEKFTPLLGGDDYLSRFWSTKGVGSRDFAWGDFAVNPDAPALQRDVGSCRWIYGRAFVQTLMVQHGVAAIVRGHQHHDPLAAMLRAHDGITALWVGDDVNTQQAYPLQQGMVCTLLLAQSSGSHAAEGLNDVFAELTVGADTLDQWRLTKRSADKAWYMPRHEAVVSEIAEAGDEVAAIDAAVHAGGDPV